MNNSIIIFIISFSFISCNPTNSKTIKTENHIKSENKTIKNILKKTTSLKDSTNQFKFFIDTTSSIKKGSVILYKLSVSNYEDSFIGFKNDTIYSCLLEDDYELGTLLILNENKKQLLSSFADFYYNIQLREKKEGNNNDFIYEFELNEINSSGDFILFGDYPSISVKMIFVSNKKGIIKVALYDKDKKEDIILD